MKEKKALRSTRITSFARSPFLDSRFSSLLVYSLIGSEHILEQPSGKGKCFETLPMTLFYPHMSVGGADLLVVLLQDVRDIGLLLSPTPPFFSSGRKG